MTRARLALATAAVLALAALALARGDGDRGRGEGAAPAGSAARPERPLLVVTQELESREPYPIEGALSYLRLRGPGAIRYEARFSHQDFTLEYPVRLGGTYTLTSYQRVCGGNCGELALEPPSERCTRRFPIGARQVVRATIRLRFGRGCTISTSARG